MAVLRACVLLLFATQPWSPSQATSGLRRHTRVELSRSLATASGTYSTLSIPPGASHTLRCSSGCAALPWCHVWCHDAVAKECLFSNIFVMPDYEETNATDAYPCYTARPRSLVSRATIESSREATMSYPLRVKENLLDGYYVTGNMNGCLFLKGGRFPWFLLDFGGLVSFQHVRIVVQTGKRAPEFNNVEVRTGTSPVSPLGDFSSYTFLAKFVGPATRNQVVAFDSPSPVAARFVSVQKTSEQGMFQPCHVEVY